MRRLVGFLALFTLLGLASFAPTAAAPGTSTAAKTSPGSGPVSTGENFVAQYKRWLAHPEQAPATFQDRIRAVAGLIATSRSGPAPSFPADHTTGVFNHDTTGLPQNEESVSACPTDPGIVLSGTNDFRGILDPQGNFTGWYFSTDGGATLKNEGLLPAVQIGGQDVPSGGDPVDVVDDHCNLYAASLNYGAGGSGVGVYRSTPETLAGCPKGDSYGGMTHPECWPQRRNLATAARGHFLDKEWMDVGTSGKAGEVVWIAWGDLSKFAGPYGAEHSGQIYAVRCSADLVSCTDPMLVSGDQQVAEYPDITIASDGRVYMTWSQFLGSSFLAGSEQGWMAVAQPGSTRFSAPRPIGTPDDRILRGHPLGYFHANGFRLIGSLYTNTVKMVAGHPRIFVTWNDCAVRLNGTLCEEGRINLTYSDDAGKSWSGPTVISLRGDNYFNTIDYDTQTDTIVAGYYTNRFDPVYHNRQDVEIVELNSQGGVVSRKRVTSLSNETEADAVVGGSFIGDYIELSAVAGRVYVAYNANQRHVRLLGQGEPIPQQDNYLAKIQE